MSVNHNLALQVGLIIRADSLDVTLTGNKHFVSRTVLIPYLELAGFLKFHHIALTLQRAACGQKNVLVVAVDIFHPIGKPSYGFVMNDSFPVPRHVGDRNGNVLANVNGDILGTNAELFRRSVGSPFN